MCAAPRGYSLHVGLNYVDPAHYQGWDGRLAACENDADDMLALATNAGYDTRKLLRSAATRTAFTKSVTDAAAALQPGDIFLLTFSGHGGQIPNAAGGDIEPDGMDETLCLFDGQLVDDELELLWRQFRPGVRILMVSDSCNSETVARFAPQMPGIEAPITQPQVKAMPEAIKRRVYEAHRAEYIGIQLATKAALDQQRGPATYTVRLLAGCQDGTSSYDGLENGAFTAALLKAWDFGRFAGDYGRFYNEIVRRLREAQIPQLQYPQHNVFGIPDPTFDVQQPFAIESSPQRVAMAARGVGNWARATMAIERYMLEKRPNQLAMWRSVKPKSWGMDESIWLTVGLLIVDYFNETDPAGVQIDLTDEVRNAIANLYDRPLSELHEYLFKKASAQEAQRLIRTLESGAAAQGDGQ